MPRLLPFLMLCALLPLPAAGASVVTLADVALGYDDNIISARDGLPRRVEQWVQAGLGSALSAPLAKGASLRVQGRLDGRAHARYEGLNELTAGADGLILIRPGRSFYTPTFGLGMGMGFSRFQSALRSAQEARARLTVREALTTRLAARGSLFTLWRGSESEVFDTHIQGGELALDWQAATPLSLTLGYQYREGRVVSIGRPGASARANAAALADDDVFEGLSAFSFDAQTHIGSALASYALSPKLSWEVQLRYVESDTAFSTRYHRWTMTTGVSQRF